MMKVHVAAGPAQDFRQKEAGERQLNQHPLVHSLQVQMLAFEKMILSFQCTQQGNIKIAQGPHLRQYSPQEEVMIRAILH